MPSFLKISLLFACCLIGDAHTQNQQPKSRTHPIFESKQIMNTSANPPILSLDVVGVGITVEMLRQGQVWQTMQKMGDALALPTDPDKYEKASVYRELISEKRAANTLEWAAGAFVEKWPIPSVSVWPDKLRVEEFDKDIPSLSTFGYNYERVNNLRAPAGMHHHKIALLGAVFKDDAEEVLERAFLFMEQNPQVPVILILASDSDDNRASTGHPNHEKYLKSGPRLHGAMSETVVALVLARRERVDAMRPGAKAFQASQYLPTPWNAEQIEVFDSLPTIAIIHRPIRISYLKDKDGKPTFDAKQKAKRLSPQEQQAAFQAALTGFAKHGEPARIFYDAGSAATGKHVVPLTMALHQALPHFDLFDAAHGFNIHRRLGETGTASPFVQWAVAAIAAFKQNEVSYAVNLRQANEATISVITPAKDKTKRRHPKGDPIDFNLSLGDGTLAAPPLAQADNIANIALAQAENPFDADATLPPSSRRLSTEEFDALDPDATLPPGFIRPDWPQE